MKKKLKVLFIFDSPFFQPRGYDFRQEFKYPDWATERTVYRSLKDLGHEVTPLGLHDDITVLIEEVRENRPDVVFNMVEVFNARSPLEKNVAWVLEMLDVPYTGASPTSLLVCNNKAISKALLMFHRIKVPRFHTFYRNRKVWLPKRLHLPAVIKPLCEEASRGISQASVVDNEDAFCERIKWIHEKMNMDAIAEEYIDGREMYVSVLGNRRVKVFMPRELRFGRMPQEEHRIATYKAKWDNNYRKKWNIRSVAVPKLANNLWGKISDICKRAYHVLNMQCYARFDIRVTPNQQIYMIEPNANPCLTRYDEFPEAAAKAGIPYTKLIQKIISLAFQRTK